MSDPASANNTQSNITSEQNGEPPAPAPVQSSSAQETSQTSAQPQPAPESADDEELSEPPGDASIAGTGDQSTTDAVCILCSWLDFAAINTY
jgi:hypothetical protein